MKNQTAIVFLLTLAGIVLVNDQANAQRPWRARGPLNRYHRFTGAFFSDGYHVATPGPNVSYYNPYSAHNRSRFAQSGFYGGSAIQYSTPTFQYPRAHQYQQRHVVPNAPGGSVYRPYTQPQRAPAAPKKELPKKPDNQRDQIKPKVPPQKSPSDDASARNRPTLARPVNYSPKRDSNLEQVLEIDQ